MVLVLACTLAQVKLGTWPARSSSTCGRWFVWWDVPGTGWRIPVFPGGALVGLVLIVNLLAAQLRAARALLEEGGDLDRRTPASSCSSPASS